MQRCWLGSRQNAARWVLMRCKRGVPVCVSECVCTCVCVCERESVHVCLRVYVFVGVQAH